MLVRTALASRIGPRRIRKTGDRGELDLPGELTVLALEINERVVRWTEIERDDLAHEDGMVTPLVASPGSAVDPGEAAVQTGDS
jgi:hypothetical protein